jgi:hypothetical protein
MCDFKKYFIFDRTELGNQGNWRSELADVKVYYG